MISCCYLTWCFYPNTHSGHIVGGPDYESIRVVFDEEVKGGPLDFINKGIGIFQRDWNSCMEVATKAQT